MTGRESESPDVLGVDRRTVLKASALAVVAPGLWASNVRGNRHGRAHGRGPALLIVDNGAPAATVFTTDGADEQTRYAAQVLVEYIERATGATLPVHEYDPAVDLGDATVICVGFAAPGAGITPDDLSDLEQDGYILRRTGNAVTIAGADGWGTRYGVYEFLERFVDVRWLMPDDVLSSAPNVGSDVPARTDLTVRGVDVVDSPAFVERTMGPFPAPRPPAQAWDWEHNDPVINARMKSWGRFARLRHNIEFIHNLFAVIKPRKFGDPNKPDTYHPEFFPIHNGETYIPAPGDNGGWQPRFSAPGIAEAAAGEVIEFLRANPDRTSYSLAVNDQSGFSEDDFEPGVTNHFGFPSASEAYYAFVNAVASLVEAEFPDVKFGVLAYTNVGDPPSFPLHHNVIPFLTKETYGWVRDDIRNADHQWVEQWQAVATDLGWWDYAFGNPYMVPRMYLDSMGETLRYFHDHGVIGVMSQLKASWAEGPKPWVYSRLLWDPRQSARRLTLEWCRRAVGGRAGIRLAQYYEFWDEFWTQRVPNSAWFDDRARSSYFQFGAADYLELVTEDDIASSRQLMRAARQLTQDAEQAGRMNVLWRTFEYVESSALSYPKRTPEPQTEAQAITLIDQASNVLDRNLGLVDRRRELSTDIDHDSRGSFPFWRFPGLVWSGWNLHPVWQVAQYIRDHEPAGGPVRAHVEQVVGAAESPNVRKLSELVLSLSDGQASELGGNVSFETGDIAPWTIVGGNASVVDSAARTGAHSVRLPTGFSGALRQTIDVQPGFYRFEAHLKASQPGSGAYGKLATVFYDKNGRQQQRLNTMFSLDRVGDGWYKVAHTDFVQPGVVRARCSVTVDSHVEHPVYIDDVSVIQLPPPDLDSSWQVVFSDNFDSDPAGAPPPDFVTTSPGTLLVEPAQGRGNVVTLHGTGSDPQSATRQFEALGGDLRLSYQVRMDQSRVGTSVKLVDDAGVGLARIAMTSAVAGNKFVVSDGEGWHGTGIGFAAGTWYAIDIVVHSALNYIDAYLDGSLIGSGAMPDGGVPTGVEIHTNPGLRAGEAGLSVDDLSVLRPG